MIILYSMGYVLSCIRSSTADQWNERRTQAPLARHHSNRVPTTPVQFKKTSQPSQLACRKPGVSNPQTTFVAANAQLNAVTDLEQHQERRSSVQRDGDAAIVGQSTDSSFKQLHENIDAVVCGSNFVAEQECGQPQNSARHTNEPHDDAHPDSLTQTQNIQEISLTDFKGIRSNDSDSSSSSSSGCLAPVNESNVVQIHDEAPEGWQNITQHTLDSVEGSGSEISFLQISVPQSCEHEPNVGQVEAAGNVSNSRSIPPDVTRLLSVSEGIQIFDRQEEKGLSNFRSTLSNLPKL